MAQSLFQVIKGEHPTSTLSVLAPAWTRALTERMPEVDRAFALEFSHGELGLKKRLQTARMLEKEGFTHAIILPNSLKSALIPLFAKIPLRTGFRGEMRWGLINDLRLLNKELLPLMVQRFEHLGRPATEEAPPPYRAPRLTAHPAAGALSRLGLEKLQSPLLALCPGAEYGPAKRWPTDHYAKVAMNRIEAGWQVWLFGSENDRPVTTQIQAHCSGQCVDLAGATDLGDAIDLIRLADGVVSNDSGLMHVAAALGRPLIALFGPTSADHTPPLGEYSWVLSTEQKCRPCFKRECPLDHQACLAELDPERVINRLESLPLVSRE